MANTIKQFMRGGDAVLCQMTVTTSFLAYTATHSEQKPRLVML